jgi:hypothetical protein
MQSRSNNVGNTFSFPVQQLSLLKSLLAMGSLSCDMFCSIDAGEFRIRGECKSDCGTVMISNYARGILKRFFKTPQFILYKEQLNIVIGIFLLFIFLCRYRPILGLGLPP